MVDKYMTDSEEYSYNGKSSSNLLLRQDNELFIEETYKKKAAVLQVKRVKRKNLTDEWVVYKNADVLFRFDGDNLGVKEKDYLKTAEGMSFLMTAIKSGLNSEKALAKMLKGKVV